MVGLRNGDTDRLLFSPFLLHRATAAEAYYMIRLFRVCFCCYCIACCSSMIGCISGCFVPFMKLFVSAIFLESCVAERVGLLKDESWFMHSSEVSVEARGILRDWPLMEVVMPR